MRVVKSWLMKSALRPVVGLRPCDRMRDGRMLGVDLVAPIGHAELVEALRREVLGERVLGAQNGNEVFHRLRQCVVCRVHAGPERVAADGSITSV